MAIRQPIHPPSDPTLTRLLSDDAWHVAFARKFGEPDVSAVIVKPGAEYRLAPHSELTDVGNIDDDERVASKNRVRHQIGRGNDLFHVDCSYNARRAGYSILRAHQLPPKGAGGRTEFADTRTAPEGLDNATKEISKDHVLCHLVVHSRQLGAPECDLFKSREAEDHTMARHRLVQLHELSRRTNLYIAAHAHHVDGWSKKESQPVIDDLLRHSSQDQNIFIVDWEDNGDLVIWDNTCVMRKAPGSGFEGNHVRDMRATAVYDDWSSACGLNWKHCEGCIA
ncbi:taurine catabolism dioxygenase tauD, tfdA family protein [Hirsutella rhossiliensis]|uniref:Taurine catabolism dioxygenase tauD, tfdA family domain-containing protein n=1 Tax=Hirsutella rhossiliensis TaxID=111463 RepID=A0A9P8SH70_9HYPO|nr:taurine catabolism dioxygenase tauD, tfdA family domain-containing protein [Hirsutella rhossiliensis]KAH0962793.1 taurine catabolism dioxygenase tauD, tfdA family domain-containing protein [Hirsutella rhossiliensis]